MAKLYKWRTQEGVFLSSPSWLSCFFFFFFQIHNSWWKQHCFEGFLATLNMANLQPLDLLHPPPRHEVLQWLCRCWYRSRRQWRTRGGEPAANGGRFLSDLWHSVMCIYIHIHTYTVYMIVHVCFFSFFKITYHHNLSLSFFFSTYILSVVEAKLKKVFDTACRPRPSRNKSRRWNRAQDPSPVEDIVVATHRTCAE